MEFQPGNKIAFISKSTKLLIHAVVITTGYSVITVKTDAGHIYSLDQSRVVKCHCSETNPYYCIEKLHNQQFITHNL